MKKVRLSCLLLLIGCGTIPVIKEKYEILYSGEERYDHAKSYVILIADTAKQIVKDEIPLLLHQISDSLNTPDYSIEIYDNRNAAIMSKGEHEMNDQKITKKDDDFINKHLIATYEGGLEYEGKPAFQYKYQLSYYKNGEEESVIEFRP